MAEKNKKGSETVEIWRHELHFNTKNVKRHSAKEIKLQVKNIRKRGYLGGIVYNVVTQSLIDGHRRVLALDEINKYNEETNENDYKLKVEQVEFDEKAEREQLAFMALGNSKADYNLVANIIDDIDYSEVGISDEDYQRIKELQADIVPEVGMGDMDDTFISQPEPVTELDDADSFTTEEIINEHENKPHMTKEQVKGEKAKQDRVASNRQENQDLYVFLSFDNVEDKFYFCELLGVQPTNSMMCRGSDVLRLIE